MAINSLVHDAEVANDFVVAARFRHARSYPDRDARSKGRFECHSQTVLGPPRARSVSSGPLMASSMAPSMK